MGNNEPREEQMSADKLDMQTVFMKHLLRISEASSKISEPGGVTNFKATVLTLKAFCAGLITEKEIKTKSTDVNALRAKRMSGEQLTMEMELLSFNEEMDRLGKLMIAAREKGRIRGFMPPEKEFGVMVSG